jgi:hypothetical protein
MRRAGPKENFKCQLIPNSDGVLIWLVQGLACSPASFLLYQEKSKTLTAKYAEKIREARRENQNWDTTQILVVGYFELAERAA